MKSSVPAYYLLSRPFGSVHWSEPWPFPAYPSVLEARQRARHLMAHGVAGLEAGRLTDWRLVRHGVIVECWQETGTP